MKYGTSTELKYTFPYIKGFPSSTPILSPKARMRLKWMDYIHKGKSVSQTSRHFDIPEPTVRYWYKQYDPFNLSTLEDKSRRPHTVRSCELDDPIINRVIELRKQYQGWGKVKLQTLLKRESIHVGQTRIQKIINQSGLKRIPASKRRYYKRKNRRHMYAVPKEVLQKPGGLVYLDVKHLYLPGGLKAYQFVAIDHATRMVKTKVFTRITSKSGRLFLDYLQEEYPFRTIRYIGSDNGSEFLGELDKELERREIKHVFSSPRAPKQNPFVERVIQTMIKEVYEYKGLRPTIQEQQKEIDNYVVIYNEIRPHHSLGLKTPLEMFNILSTSTS
jgi:transposase InsO family protein